MVTCSPGCTSKNFLATFDECSRSVLTSPVESAHSSPASGLNHLGINLFPIVVVITIIVVAFTANATATGRSNTNSSTTTYVGIHVRRGDMTKMDRLKSYGFALGGPDYVVRAMHHFLERLRSHVTFIICSDNIWWCRRNIVLPATVHRSKYDVRFCNKSDSAIVHLGILSSCNHSIITGGTFGWWSAFLSGGHTVYYRGYPRPNSRFAKGFSANRTDHYMPGWVALD